MRDASCKWDVGLVVLLSVRGRCAPQWGREVRASRSAESLAPLGGAAHVGRRQRRNRAQSLPQRDGPSRQGRQSVAGGLQPPVGGFPKPPSPPRMGWQGTITGAATDNGFGSRSPRWGEEILRAWSHGLEARGYMRLPFQGRRQRPYLSSPACRKKGEPPRFHGADGALMARPVPFMAEMGHSWRHRRMRGHLVAPRPSETSGRATQRGILAPSCSPPTAWYEHEVRL